MSKEFESTMGTESKELAAIEKSSRVTITVLKVLSVFAKIGFVVSIVGAILCGIAYTPVGAKYLIDNGGFSYESMAMDVQIFGFDLTGYVSQEEIAGKEALLGLAMCILCIIVTAVLIVVFKKIRNIFESIIAKGTPFENSIVESLKKVFILLTVIILLCYGITSAALIGVIFWCVYTIFLYGVSLQKQADETL